MSILEGRKKVGNEGSVSAVIRVSGGQEKGERGPREGAVAPLFIYGGGELKRVGRHLLLAFGIYFYVIERKSVLQ